MVDSGVRVSGDDLVVTSSDRVPDFAVADGYVSWQGTALAGIIAGADTTTAAGEELAVGLAPAAKLVDERVYDVGPESANDEQREPTAAGLIEGLRRLEPKVRKKDGVRIVNVSLRVSATPAEREQLAEAVGALTARGAIVVAAAGDRRDVQQSDSDEGGYELGEDYADRIWPAALSRTDPRVVAVTTSVAAGQDVTAAMVESSAIDVAVPSAGAVSYAINGTPCSLDEPSTAVAAAQVSGVLALLLTVFPDENADQVIARLEGTATGGSRDPDNPDVRVGRGIVQPVEALTRALRPGRRGDLGGSTRPDVPTRPVALPEPEPDVLADTRSDAIWWGLLGGGGLLLALLLRPVLARRRD